MKLCREMPNIDAFVHISTGSFHFLTSLTNYPHQETDSRMFFSAFVNSDRYEGTIEEKVYPCKINYKDMEKSLKWMSDDAVQKLLDEILGDRLVYIFSCFYCNVC